MSRRVLWEGLATGGIFSMKIVFENLHFLSIRACTFQPKQINSNSPQYNIGTHRPSQSILTTVQSTQMQQQLRVPTHNQHTQNNTATTLIWTGGMQALLPRCTFTKHNILQSTVRQCFSNYLLWRPGSFFSMCQGPACEASRSITIVSLFSGKYSRTSRHGSCTVTGTRATL